MSTRLVLMPELAYESLDATVRGLGWQPMTGPAGPPLVVGEPEFATWAQDDDLLTYACNPVAWLRVLDLSGVAEPARRSELLAAVPLLEYDRLPRLLRSSRPETVLLGVLAVDLLAAREHLPAVRALMHHREPAVARAAQRVTAAFASGRA